MKERIYKFDNIKILLIFFVVLGHCVELYTDKYSAMAKIFIFIYSFHMPLFIFISGLFQKRIIYYKELNKKKLLYYIFLVLLMMIMLATIDIFFGKDVSFSLLSGYNVYWYLVILIVYSCLIPIINKLNIKFLLIMSVLLSLASGYDNNIGDYLFLSRIIIFFPYFCLGYYCSDKKDKLINITRKKGTKIISLIIVVIYAYICYSKLSLVYPLRGLFTGRNSYNSLTIIKNCSYLHRLLTYTISFILGFCILCIIPNKKIKIITNLGKRTLQVYIFHQEVIYILKNTGIFDILEKEFAFKFVFIIIVIAFIITTFLSIMLFKKIMDKLYTTIFNTKEV